MERGPGQAQRRALHPFGYPEYERNPLRVSQLRGPQPTRLKSWAIQFRPDSLEAVYWEKRGVDLLEAPVDAYIAELARRVQDLPPAGGGAN